MITIYKGLLHPKSAVKPNVLRQIAPAELQIIWNDPNNMVNYPNLIGQMVNLVTFMKCPKVSRDHKINNVNL